MNSSIFLVVRKYLAKILTGDLTLRRGDQMLNLIIAPMLPRGKLRIYTWTHFRICWKMCRLQIENEFHQFCGLLLHESVATEIGRVQRSIVGWVRMKNEPCQNPM